MDVHITLGPVGDRAERMYRQLSEAIVDGRLREGEALPPTRELARQLGVSRTTVTVAYDRLLSEGFTVARPGAGTFVRGVLSSSSTRRAPRGGVVHPRPRWLGHSDLPGRAGPTAYDFAVGVADATLFPLEKWRRAVVRELQPGAAVLGGYSAAQGYPPLRAAIARHIGLSRAVRTGADDVIVTSGAQQAFDLVARVLVAPGDTVAVEEPGYPPVRALFESYGAKVVGVPVDAHGIVVTEIPPRARVVYTTPSHQFPTGTRMSFDRRLALLEWAASNNGVIVEDDYDSEFRYHEQSLDPLQSLDRAGRVVYVGTFSKTLLPGLRIGFVVAPESLQRALVEAKRLVDWHTETLSQAALARMIDDGSFAAHVRKASRCYADRRTHLLDSAGAELARWMTIVPSVAGLHVFAEFVDGFPATGQRIVDAALSEGVGIQSIESFTTSAAPRTGLVLGFGRIESEHVATGIHRLAGVVARLA